MTRAIVSVSVPLMALACCFFLEQAINPKISNKRAAEIQNLLDDAELKIRATYREKSENPNWLPDGYRFIEVDSGGFGAVNTRTGQIIYDITQPTKDWTRYIVCELTFGYTHSLPRIPFNGKWKLAK